MSKYILVICTTFIIVLLCTTAYYKHQADKVPILEDALQSKEKQIKILQHMQEINDAIILTRDSELSKLKEKRKIENKELEELRDANKEVNTWGEQFIPIDLLHKDNNKDRLLSPKH